MTFDKLPADLDAERAIIGAILLDNGCIAQAESLKVEHFTHFAHRIVYSALLELWADGVGADIVSVQSLLRTRKKLEEVGGLAFLSGLTEGVPPRANIETYTRILQEKKQLRDIITNANLAISRAIDQSEKPEKILKDIQDATVEIGADTAAKERDIFLNVVQFTRQTHEEIEWRVHKLIEVGTNGLLLGLPKGGKSMIVAGLAASLASGAPWLDFPVKRARTALVSREDYAGTTARRIRKYIAGTGISDDDIRDWLYVSSRAQLPSLMLDNPSDLRMLINNLKRRKVEFCIMDVLNVLHSKDENDNTEMRQVLKCVDHIRNEAGCQMLVVHHSRKQWDDGMTLSESARGSTAIGGFAEFLIGVRMVDEDNQIRQMKFETKAAEPHRPLYWKIEDTENGGVTLQRCNIEPVKEKAKAKGATSK